MTFGSEAGAVQHPFIRYAIETGWTYLTPQKTLELRRGETGLLLHDVFLERVQALNSGVVDFAAAEDLAARLVRVRADLEGNLEAWEYLAGLKTVYHQGSSRDLNVRLMATGVDARLNALHVTQEMRFTGGKSPIRQDIVFYVNGIPVLDVEAKAPHVTEAMQAARDQVKRYHAEAASLMALEQLMAVTHIAQFLYAPTWNHSRKALLNWRDEQAGDFETLVKHFIAPERLTRILSDYVLFSRRDGELSKLVLRPHQMNAIEKILNRARDSRARRGLVWHTQGSGKTFTMIVAARLMLSNPVFESPTVIMLVDRNELEQQLFQNIDGLDVNVRVAESKRDLRHLLHTDHRGLIVSTIHLFAQMESDVNTRENIFVLVDEAHRTTGGDLGSYLMAALPNATLIGFTGTPVMRSKTGRGTFDIFGGNDEAGYLSKYSIADSLRDETTVPLSYMLAPNDLRVDREVLEREFLAAAEAEGISDIEELNRVLERATTLRAMLKQPERLERIAAFVAKHFRENVEPLGFKAFLVGVDREACAMYKRALDRHLPPEYSRVVFSGTNTDSEFLKLFHLDDATERAVRDDFKHSQKLPKILIVTEKLLTGYDAPNLFAMYLDKPMRDHVLLQTIARVNRPQDGKRAGLIVDFVGIFEKLERALAFDSQDVVSVITDLSVLMTHFKELMRVAREQYLPLIDMNLTEDKRTEAVLNAFRDAEPRQAFYKFFKQVSDAYEVLSPDAELVPFLNDYELLARMVRSLKGAYEPRLLLDEDFVQKTEALMQAHTSGGNIIGELRTYELGIETLERIAENRQAPIVEIFNLLKTLNGAVEQFGTERPYLRSIGERAEAIAVSFEARQLESQEALEELIALVREALDAQEGQTATGFDKDVFTVYWLLAREGITESDRVAEVARTAFAAHPHWATDERQEGGVRSALYKALAKLLEPQKLLGFVDRLFKTLKGI
jgi:type I restriction enzyme, R subunit